jgi:hypothetical protein
MSEHELCAVATPFLAGILTISLAAALLYGAALLSHRPRSGAVSRGERIRQLAVVPLALVAIGLLIVAWPC